VNTLHLYFTGQSVVNALPRNNQCIVRHIWNKYIMCEKCLTQCAFLHGETPKRIFRISRNPYLWKTKQYKAAVRGARRLLQYCQQPSKISRDILRYIWSVCGISKILFIHSTTARETLAVKRWLQGFKSLQISPKHFLAIMPGQIYSGRN
jgi:hypothetical protein